MVTNNMGTFRETTTSYTVRKRDETPNISFTPEVAMTTIVGLIVILLTVVAVAVFSVGLAKVALFIACILPLIPAVRTGVQLLDFKMSKQNRNTANQIVLTNLLVFAGMILFIGIWNTQI